MSKAILLRVLVYLLVLLLFPLVALWTVVRPAKIILSHTPRDYLLPYEDVTLKTQDGLHLAAWYVVSPDGDIKRRRAIILVHGYPAEKADMLGVAAPLYPDFDLLLFDLRYFGKSEGWYTTLGIKERYDLKAALSFLESKGYDKIGVLGFSLGGATALLSAPEDARIDAVVSYASFSDLKTLGEESYRSIGIFRKPLVASMLLYARYLFGASAKEVSPVNAARRIRTPVFLIHTKQDEQIPFGHAERLRDALREQGRGEFYFPEAGLHGELPLDFNKKIKDFFQARLM